MCLTLMWRSVVLLLVVFFKQVTAYEMRICDWSSDVCPSDLYSSVHGDPVHEGHHRLVTGEQLVVELVFVMEEPSARCAAIVQRRIAQERSEERRVGKDCVSTFRSRWSPNH